MPAPMTGAESEERGWQQQRTSRHAGSGNGASRAGPVWNAIHRPTPDATEGTSNVSQRQQRTHLDQIQDVTPSAEGCEDCLRIGDTWVHLRECLTRGHAGCCDSSKNTHATSHPIIRSFERGGNWMWCYVDEIMIAPAR